MICDNCGAEIDNQERYCPNCGMELPKPKSSKNKPYKRSQQSKPDKFQSKRYKDYPKGKPPKKSENSDFMYIPHPRADYTKYNEEEDYKRKPLKRKYYGASQTPKHYDSEDEADYESYYNEEEVPETKKSRISLGTICLFMVMILLLGFVIGLILFSNTQVTPQVPGFNS